MKKVVLQVIHEGHMGVEKCTSRNAYSEVISLASKTVATTIKAMQVAFSRHGIPNTVIADNVPFNSSEFQKFAKQRHFTSITTSPNYPQSNGLNERNVQTIKRLYKKAIEDNTSFDRALETLPFLKWIFPQHSCS